MIDEELVEIYRGRGGDLLGHSLRALLKEAGIPSEIRNEATGVGGTFLPESSASIRVLVLGRDRVRAQRLVAGALQEWNGAAADSDAIPSVGVPPTGRQVAERLVAGVLFFVAFVFFVEPSSARVAAGLGLLGLGIALVTHSRKAHSDGGRRVAA